MRNFFLLILFLSQFSFAQDEIRIYIDENKNQVSENLFQNTWRDKEKDLYRWDFITDKTRNCTLKTGRHEYPEVNYDSLSKTIATKFNTTISKNAILVIKFRYKNDLCTSIYNNDWDNIKINRRLDFDEDSISEFKSKLKNQELKVFYVFENGINLKINLKKEKYSNILLDSDNFFRNNFFKNQAMCGSVLLITPTGTLLYNGEYSLKHLLIENIE